KQEQFETLCRLLGRDDLPADPRFQDRDDRKKHRYALKHELEQSLACKSASAWSVLLNEQGVPAGEVLTVPEILAHDHIAERGFVKTFEDVPGADTNIAIAGAGFCLQTGDPGPKTPPPTLGADTDDLLAELGYGEDELEMLRNRGAV
ncbi:MAG: CoA transferase, partial [Geminicoccaceae bacterium]